MSKHLGNILRADAADGATTAPTRCAGSWPRAARPGCSAGSGTAVLQEIVRKTLLTYWNTASFLTLYAGANDWAPGEADPAVGRPCRRSTGGRCPRLHRLVGEVTAAYEGFDTQRVGRLLAAYVDDLSNWYVRRSRRRFWDGDPAALATLHECLHVAHPAAGAGGAVRHRAGLAGRRPAGQRRRRTAVGAPGRRGRSRTAPWSTTRWPARSRWSAGWSSSAGRPGPSPRSATASRSAARSSAPPAGPTLPDELQAARSPTSSTCTASTSWPASWSTAAPRATSAPWASGSARTRPRWPRRSPRPTRRRWRASLRDDRRGHRRGRRRGGRGDRRRGAAHRDPAGGLGGRDRGRRDRRARPRAHPGAAPGRPGPRGRPAGAGGAQDLRPAGHRPGRAALGGRRRARRGAAGARRAGRRRGACHVVRRGAGRRRRRRAPTTTRLGLRFTVTRTAQ